MEAMTACLICGTLSVYLCLTLPDGKERIKNQALCTQMRAACHM